MNSYDFFIAIAYPCLALAYCFSTFSFDYKLLEINLDIYPTGWFETIASVIADPVQTAITHRILKSLRIVSVLDFFARIGVNMFLCVRLHYIVGLLHDSSWRKIHPYNVDAKHRYLAGAVFLCLAAMVVIFVEESLRTSTLACKPHEECRVNVWRWTNLPSDSLIQCPCLTMIDEDKTPKPYAEWIRPKDLTEKLRSELEQETSKRFSLPIDSCLFCRPSYNGASSSNTCKCRFSKLTCMVN